MKSSIDLFGVRQNNLKDLDVQIRTGELTVITGVSGSGKSSLAFDTLYAEGQRRYVETFSPYARQFLDRMDKPQVDRIEGILPAIAIDQTNPVRNSRSTVGTMTEVNDHLKLLFARAATLYCRGCGDPVHPDSAQSILQTLQGRCQELNNPRLIITFAVEVPQSLDEAQVQAFLDTQGYVRVHTRDVGNDQNQRLYVVQDRLRLQGAEPQRVIEALEAALRMGRGQLSVFAVDDDGQDQAVWRFSSTLHCASCDLDYAPCVPSTFSFNSPLGACDACRGFGRVIGVDLDLVLPDTSKSLRAGVVKPWQTPSFLECQRDLEKFARREGIAIDIPWRDLPPEHQKWVIEGDPLWKGGRKAWQTQWYGVHHFFEWLESRAYKMHVRVLLSKYRSYTPCPSCHGSRLKADALLWRVGDEQAGRYDFQALMAMPIAHLRDWFESLTFDDKVMDAAMVLVRQEVLSRLTFLCDVGLGYLALERQSRTLSGGEVQRINLTTALGTSLVNTLFVLDEPSIGLHAKDMHRVTQIMYRLRDAGNTLVVVEHDPQVMMAADRVIDMGPGPGEKGGQIVFDGTPAQLRQANTLTGLYLSGKRSIEAPRPVAVTDGTPRLILEGVRAHNLKNIDVHIPMGRMVCVTGVSGSGKSTLIENVLFPALQKHFGRPTEAPGAHLHLLGAEQLADVVMVDQSAIGKTTRSTPASYVGAFDAIRKLFAGTPLAKERQYTAGTFSFNSGDGRCPTCAGTGFEHVEMQFLSDVYLRCPDCEGRRFRPEICEVRLEHLEQSASIDEVLEMTVSQALTFFKGLRQVQGALATLVDVGLEYIRLGQPVPTLSGGEAQRLKLAGHLVQTMQSASRQRLAQKPILFLFDEPTTGLHLDDIARLMGAFRKLLAAGHSLLIIEHNLDVVAASDWIIDLGPEGGDAGGQLMAQGAPADLMAQSDSLTAQALREYSESLGLPLAQLQVEPKARTHKPVTSIDILHAREHNLQDISVSIPHGKFTVITGVSGSGKSTLAFDILFNEGQRRYLESINAYARAIVQPAGQPDVDAIYGIAPTVAIEQRTSRGGHKSTVATMTEIYHFLRVLYLKLGVQYCPSCNIAVTPQTSQQIMAQIMREHEGEHIGIMAPLVMARKGYYTDLARWARQKGHTHLRVDGEFLTTRPWPRLDRYKEHTIELPVADLIVDKGNEAALREAIETALHHGQGVLSILWPLERLKKDLQADLEQRHFSTKRACSGCGQSFAPPDPRLFSYNSKHGWCLACFGTGVQLTGFDDQQTGEESQWLQADNQEVEPCASCHGTRLNPVARAVRWQERSIAEFTALSVHQAQAFLNDVHLQGRDASIARDILPEIRSRLDFMREVGLDYLALDRAAPTLSGGEAQRIRLAAQLGSNLQGVCYVLDEPTIGLHPRDNHILLNALSRLQSHGNTLVVVEHDHDTIRRADHVIDIGPGAGVRGGRIVAQGTVQDIERSQESVTGRYLREPLQHSTIPHRAIDGQTEWIAIKRADLHNLKDIDVRVPLGRLTVVTGVSGSGKSSLARDVLLNNLVRALGAQGQPMSWRGCHSISGWEGLDRILEVDQTPIGKTPRSCPATYVGFWDVVRRQFADTQEARIRGWGPGRFSFNTGDGRCPVCEGRGMRTIEMSFLPDVKVPCDACFGMRFNPQTLAVKLRGLAAGEVLRLEVDDAIDYFSAHPRVLNPLQLMQDVGLGYLTLGQASPTLSGGEAQRIKLVSELSKAHLGTRRRSVQSPKTLYVLDEPTVGLSVADVEKLIHVLHRLVDAGHSVVVIEHNLDVIAQADWLIDLGPEGGTAGGEVVAQGSPWDVVQKCPHSHTAVALKPMFRVSA